MGKTIKSNKNLRKFLQGIQLHVRIYGLRVNVYTSSIVVMINKQIQPNIMFDLDTINFALNCINAEDQQRLIINQQLSLRHVMVIETSRSGGYLKMLRPRKSTKKKAAI